MAFIRYHHFLNLVIFYAVLQNNILTSEAETQCLNPKFGQNQKIVVDYFYQAEDGVWPDEDLCKIINEFNGLISMVYRMRSDMAEKETCLKSYYCTHNRRYACNYKFHQDVYNDCTKKLLPSLTPEVADCVCSGTADDILTKNETAFASFGVKKTPLLIVDNKYDPCFTDYSLKGMKAYLCKAFQNVVPPC